MTKLEEVEALREAVIKKHFPNYPMFRDDAICRPYSMSVGIAENQSRLIDEKVLYYTKLGISAEELKAKL